MARHGLTPSIRYWPRSARAARSGALDKRIHPAKGVYPSRTKKTAPETASAEKHRLANTVEFLGANRPKLMK